MVLEYEVYILWLEADSWKDTFVIDSGVLCW